MTKAFQREMTITHKDFLRLLPKALGDLAYEKVDNTIFIRDEPRAIQIRLSTESIRKLGSLVLPVTNVSIELKGFRESDEKRFLSKFDLSYQKGGG
jgi:hypothetical protein